MVSAVSMLAMPLFSIGNVQTTLGSLLVVIAVIFLTLLLGRLARNALQKVLQRVDEQGSDAARGYGLVAQIIVWVVGFELALHLLGIHLTALFAASGLFALGAGFAIKNIVENFLSGGIIRLEKTFQVDDLMLSIGTI